MIFVQKKVFKVRLKYRVSGVAGTYQWLVDISYDYWVKYPFIL
jgi:hypothetical protein